MGDFDADFESQYGFSDELLIALEQAGKTFPEMMEIILPVGPSREQIVISGVTYSNTKSGAHAFRIGELLDVSYAVREAAVDRVHEAEAVKRAAEKVKREALDYKAVVDSRHSWVVGQARMFKAKRVKLPGGVKRGLPTEEREGKKRVKADDEEIAVKGEVKEEATVKEEFESKHVVVKIEKQDLDYNPLSCENLKFQELDAAQSQTRETSHNEEARPHESMQIEEPLVSLPEFIEKSDSEFNKESKTENSCGPYAAVDETLAKAWPQNATFPKGFFGPQNETNKVALIRQLKDLRALGVETKEQESQVPRSLSELLVFEKTIEPTLHGPMLPSTTQRIDRQSLSNVSTFASRISEPQQRTLFLPKPSVQELRYLRASQVENCPKMTISTGRPQKGSNPKSGQTQQDMNEVAETSPRNCPSIPVSQGSETRNKDDDASGPSQGDTMFEDSERYAPENRDAEALTSQDSDVDMARYSSSSHSGSELELGDNTDTEFNQQEDFVENRETMTTANFQEEKPSMSPANEPLEGGATEYPDSDVNMEDMHNDEYYDSEINSNEDDLESLHLYYQNEGIQNSGLYHSERLVGDEEDTDIQSSSSSCTLANCDDEKDNESDANFLASLYQSEPGYLNSSLTRCHSRISSIPGLSESNGEISETPCLSIPASQVENEDADDEGENSDDDDTADGDDEKENHSKGEEYDEGDEYGEGEEHDDEEDDEDENNEQKDDEEIDSEDEEGNFDDESESEDDEGDDGDDGGHSDHGDGGDAKIDEWLSTQITADNNPSMILENAEKAHTSKSPLIPQASYPTPVSLHSSQDDNVLSSPNHQKATAKCSKNLPPSQTPSSTHSDSSSEIEFLLARSMRRDISKSALRKKTPAISASTSETTDGAQHNPKLVADESSATVKNAGEMRRRMGRLGSGARRVASPPGKAFFEVEDICGSGGSDEEMEDEEEEESEEEEKEEANDDSESDEDL